MKVLQVSKKTFPNTIRERLLLSIDTEISRKSRGHHRLKSIEFNSKYLSLEITMCNTTISSATHFSTNEDNSSVVLISQASSECINQQSIMANNNSNQKISEFINNLDKKKQLISKDKKISALITLNRNSIEETIKITKRKIMIKAIRQLKELSKSLKRLSPIPSFKCKGELVSLSTWGTETKPSSRETDEDEDATKATQKEEGSQSFFLQRYYTTNNPPRSNLSLSKDVKLFQANSGSLNSKPRGHSKNNSTFKPRHVNKMNKRTYFKQVTFA